MTMPKPIEPKEVYEPSKIKVKFLEFKNGEKLSEILKRIPVHSSNVVVNAISRQDGFGFNTEDTIEVEYGVNNDNYDEELKLYEAYKAEYSRYIVDLKDYNKLQRIEQALKTLKDEGLEYRIA